MRLDARHSLLGTAICVMLCVCAAQSAWASKYALVIGNSGYAHLPRLPNPENDARAISEKIRSVGFEVQTVIDGDLETLRAQIDAFAARSSGAEQALIFFAGHGLQVRGQNYLLPVDVSLQDETQLEEAGLGVAEFFEAFNRAQAETSILILDACRNNPFVTSAGVSQGLSSGSSSAGAQRPNSAGIVIAFAAAPGAVAYDGKDGNSPYTTALLQWIDRPQIELVTMLRRVRETVYQLTGGQQVPWVEEALVKDVYLNPGRARQDEDGQSIEVALLNRIRSLDAPAEQRAASTFYDRYLVNVSSEGGGATSTDEEDQFVREGLIWLSIRRSDDPDLFRAFLSQFPNSTFAVLAQERLDELTAAPPPTVLAWLDGLAPIQPVSQITGIENIVQTAPTRPQSPTLGTLANEDQSPVVSIDPLPTSPSGAETLLGLSDGERAGIQFMLQAAGAYGGPIDADFGAGTRRAIKMFQEANNLPGTGYLDQRSLRELTGRIAPNLLRNGHAGQHEFSIHRIAAVAANGPGSDATIIRVAALERKAEVKSYLDEVADEFEAENPGNLIEFERRPGPQYNAELMSILGEESPPDILFTWGGGHLEALRQAGFARDLTQEMSQDWAFEFKPGALQNYTFDGRIYGAPRNLSLVSLYVNKPMLASAGIRLEDLSTWNGFMEALAKLRRQGVTPLAIGGKELWPFHLYFGPLVQELAGSDGMDDSLSGRGNGLATAAFLDAAEQYERLTAIRPFQQGYADMSDDEAVDHFASGGSAMMITGNWRIDKMQWKWPGGMNTMRSELGILDLPRLESGNRQMTYGGAEGFAVSTTAPDVAVDFLEVLTSIEVQQRLSELTSQIPAASGADLALSDLQREVADDVLQSRFHQLYLDMALGPAMRPTLNGLLRRVAGGEISGHDAVMALNAAWSEMLSRQ